jgi:hypothetical protein
MARLCRLQLPPSSVESEELTVTRPVQTVDEEDEPDVAPRALAEDVLPLLSVPLRHHWVRDLDPSLVGGLEEVMDELAKRGGWDISEKKPKVRRSTPPKAPLPRDALVWLVVEHDPVLQRVTLQEAHVSRSALPLGLNAYVQS